MVFKNYLHQEFELGLEGERTPKTKSSHAQWSTAS